MFLFISKYFVTETLLHFEILRLTKAFDETSACHNLLHYINVKIV